MSSGTGGTKRKVILIVIFVSLAIAAELAVLLGVFIWVDQAF